MGILCLCMADQHFYMDIVLEPHRQAMAALNLSPAIQVLKYQESFFAHLQVALISALILTMPYIIYQMWLFAAEGLYSHEQRYVRLFLPFALLLFALGVLFGYFALIPLSLQFLARYGGGDIRVGITLSSYISLFFSLTFVCGLVFELPLAMLLLDKIQIFSTRHYLDHWRHFILGAFVLAAFLTPPDAVTQLLLAGPMISLYFLGILICRVSERLSVISRFLSESPPPRNRP